MKERHFDRAELAQFIGTEHWYRHPLNGEVIFTDGAKYVADQAGAYWLLDAIALLQLQEIQVRSEEFQAWKLKVAPDMSAELLCEDGNGNVVYSNNISFTDFPCEGITLWFTHRTILLPSEY